MIRITALIYLTLLTASVFAEEWQWAPGQPVGSKLPLFEIADSNGVIHKSASLGAENGLMLFFNRSTVW